MNSVNTLWGNGVAGNHIWSLPQPFKIVPHVSQWGSRTTWRSPANQHMSGYVTGTFAMASVDFTLTLTFFALYHLHDILNVILIILLYYIFDLFCVQHQTTVWANVSFLHWFNSSVHCYSPFYLLTPWKKLFCKILAPYKIWIINSGCERI